MGALENVMNDIAEGKITSVDDAVAAFGSMALSMQESSELLTERIAELEAENAEWVKMNEISGDTISKHTIDNIARRSIAYWVKNPLIKRAVELKTSYVFGQGFSVKAKSDKVQDAVDAFMAEPTNKKVLFSQQSLEQCDTDLQLTGNLFFALFPMAKNDVPAVRTIPLEQITDVIQNPDDAQEVWYYVRSWTETSFNGSMQTKQMLYPDLHYLLGLNGKKRKLPKSLRINGVQYSIAEQPIFHLKTNCTNTMEFGISEVYAALDWAKAYKVFLEDWAAIVRALSMFAYKATSKSGSKGMSKAVSVIANAVSKSNLTNGDLPSQKAGVFAASDNFDLAPMPKSGATVNVEDSRRLLLMVCAATGIYEHYFGDPSTGNLATAKSMERPMQLMFTERQALWKDTLEEILEYAVSNMNIVLGKDDDGSIEVTFPSVVEIDTQERINAIISASTLNNQSLAGTFDIKTVTNELAIALGLNTDIVDQLFPEDVEPWSKNPIQSNSSVGQAVSEEAFIKDINIALDGLKRND